MDTQNDATHSNASGLVLQCCSIQKVEVGITVPQPLSLRRVYAFAARMQWAWLSEHWQLRLH